MVALTTFCLSNHHPQAGWSVEARRHRHGRWHAGAECQLQAAEDLAQIRGETTKLTPVIRLMFVQGNVRQLLHAKIQSTYLHAQFISDVIKPLRIEELYDQLVRFI